MNFKKLVFSAVFLAVFSAVGLAQVRLIIPKGNLNAYKKQTRSETGNPGRNYWQNSSDYQIKASVDVKNKRLSGDENVVYHNNSTDTLQTIVIRLYQDIFKKGANRNPLFDMDPFDINEGVAIGKLMVDDLELKQADLKRKGTLLYVSMPHKLLPHAQTKLHIEWSFHIPERTLIRMGTMDSTSLLVGQWYPQIAVYDDMNGWDIHSHNGMAEFYNDVNNFDVEVTVPEKFLVWATGEPVNIVEVLQPEYVSRYKKASISDEIIHVVSEEDIKRGNITTDIHTWKFKANGVTDFAFGISDHYLWDVASALVDKATGRRTVVAAAYKKDAPQFDKVANIAKETVRYLSTERPGIPFPFPYITVYNGDFGMEYPMITNVGAYKEYDATVYDNSHEIAHMYFPFYVCTNETKNGWMDEGFTVFLPEKIQTMLSPGFDEAKHTTAAFEKYAGMEDEPALITSSFYLDSRIYFYLNYGKAEQALRMLEMELGTGVFQKCLLTFMDSWKYKHPTPIDFFNTFNTVSKQNLNWFWNAWYYQNGGIPDMAIKEVNRNHAHYKITVVNRGDLPLPIVLSLYNDQKLVRTITRFASNWIEHPDGIHIDFDSSQKITKVVLGTDYIPDANRADNLYLLK